MPVGVGVIGAGTVGGGVAQTLVANRDLIGARAGTGIALVHMSDLNQEAIAALNLEGVTISSDAAALINDSNVRIVCELIGGLEPARTFILQALHAKKHVVTANKRLLATHGEELCRAAIRNGVELRFEAAVAGGIPIIKALREGLAANHVEYVYGILNGTCNYILSRMTYEGLEFEEALRQAIEMGFAETPPDLDIMGHDTAHKCQILASLCYATPVDLDAIPVEGITNITHADVAYAEELGYLIKLLAVVQKVDGEVVARVHPTLVPQTHLLAAVRNEFNAIFVQGDVADATLYYGRGAGRFPTASAVIADVVDIVRRGDGPVTPPFVYEKTLPLRDPGHWEGRYYLRLTTVDEVGVMGKVATILSEYGVSIASIIQKERPEGDMVHIVMMTHETRESELREALAKVDAMYFIGEATHVIRVL